MDKITCFRDIPQFTAEGSYAVDYPLDRLVRWIREEETRENLNLCPDFQRGHVWTEEQQVAYVTFLLRGGKTGRTLYFNFPSWRRQVPDGAYNEYVCVDGLQRITAITRFVDNEFSVFGSFYREFEDRLSLMNTMRVNINDLKTREEVLRWYIEMNAGGTPHTEKEINRIRDMLQTEKQKNQ